jgi:hypothetical protein
MKKAIVSLAVLTMVGLGSFSASATTQKEYDEYTGCLSGCRDTWMPIIDELGYLSTDFFFTLCRLQAGCFMRCGMSFEEAATYTHGVNCVR